MMLQSSKSKTKFIVSSPMRAETMPHLFTAVSWCLAQGFTKIDTEIFSEPSVCKVLSTWRNTMLNEF